MPPVRRTFVVLQPQPRAISASTASSAQPPSNHHHFPTQQASSLHPDDQQLSDKYVALFVATTGTPHAALKNKFLKKAFRVLGATCPSPKRVKSLIQDVYQETRRTVEADLSSLFEAGMAVMICTDGWRHRHAAQGHRLLNLVLLKPRSGVWFFDCYPLDRGAKKDAHFYADMHNEMANKNATGQCGATPITMLYATTSAWRPQSVKCT
ncbi:hypothetical protein V8C86DRAFT_103186 [Haematococcus lacustris]